MKTYPKESKCLVTLEPMGRRIEVDPNTTLLEAAQDAGIDLMAVCAGNGSCGMCKVVSILGSFSPISQGEQKHLTQIETRSGLRLACYTKILSNCKILFPPESLATLQRLQLEGQQVDVPIEPFVNRVEINQPPPSMSEELIDIDNVLHSINKNRNSILSFSENLRPLLLETLISNNRKATLVVNDNEVISIIPIEKQLIGYAVDVGTTKIAGYLVDLESGKTLASAGMTNPQIAYGEDVINRIKYTDENAQGGKVLQEILVQAINDLLNDLCQQVMVCQSQIVDSVMVGNTAMHHLLLGIPLHQLGTAPYQPSAIQPIYIHARDIGITIADGAYIYLPPNIAGFVGGDHVAMLLSTTARNRGKTVLAVDIGTNTEISLIHKGCHFTCSCASGPAFEGAHIREGLRAIPGAVERIYIDNGIVRVKTIQNKPAIGICGSGILDAIAELRKEKMIDKRGSFNKNDHRLKLEGGRPEFVLVNSQQSGLGREITIDRKDINQIQLAKAAIRSGVEVLIKYAQIEPEEIELILLAGAFGTYLDISNALRIGMFPPLPIERFQQVGNAAGTGAREMLISMGKRRLAEQMIGQIKYIELITVSDYMDVFMRSIGFD